MKIAVEMVEPIGTRETFAFVTRVKTCGPEMVDVPIYPADVCAAGEDLRTWRLGWGMGQRAAAKATGLLPTEYSGLEFGRFRPTTPGGYLLVKNAIAAAATAEGKTFTPFEPRELVVLP